MTAINQTPLEVIGRITSLVDIAGADRIKLAVVDCGPSGTWNGVVAGGLGVTDLVTVFLQDALLPPDPRWAFMERHKWRVRMARFKGVPSECVIIQLINGPMADAMGLAPCVGADLTAELGVTKYSKPVPAERAGQVHGDFPSHTPKTDEPNFQVIDYQWLMRDTSWYATEKADGTSCTAWVDDEGLHVCSRNWELKEFSDTGASNLYWQAARKYGLAYLPQGVALQFEIIGPGIQANPMGLAELEIRAFTVHNTTTHQRYPWWGLVDLCTKMNIPRSRHIATGFMPLNKEELQSLAEITYPNGKPGEGIVIRAMDSSWSFKVMNLLYKN